MPKRKDENEIAFSGLQDLIRRDAERDGFELPPEPKPEKVPSAVRAGRLGGFERRQSKSRKPYSSKAPRYRKEGRKDTLAEIMLAISSCLY